MDNSSQNANNQHSTVPQSGSFSPNDAFHVPNIPQPIQPLTQPAAHGETLPIAEPQHASTVPLHQEPAPHMQNVAPSNPAMHGEIVPPSSIHPIIQAAQMPQQAPHMEIPQHQQVPLATEHGTLPLHQEQQPVPAEHIAPEPVHMETAQSTHTEETLSHRVQQLQQEQQVQPAPAPASGGGSSSVPPATKKGMSEERSMLPLVKIIVGIAAFFIVGGGLLFFILSLFSKAAPQKVTLQYWGLWEDQAVMQPIITDFERQNPNIVVQYVKQDPSDYTRRLLTRIQNGTGPDIFRFQPSWLPMLEPVLEPLPQNVITTADFTKNYYPVFQQDLMKNGAIYGIPLDIDTLALFTNNDIFKKANQQVPTNWTDFISVSRALTTKDASGKIKTAGAAVGTYNNILHAPDIMSLLFVQNGVNMANLPSSSKNLADALTFYTSFANGESSVWDTTLDPSATAFAQGNLGMFFGYSWDIFTIKALNPTLNFSVYTVPHLPGRNMTIASYWAEGVSLKSKYPKEALLFMNYLTQKSTLQKLYTEEAKTRLFGELYPRSDMGNLLSSNPLIAPFIAQAATAQSSIFVGETKDQVFNAPLNQYLGNAINSVLSGTSAQTAVDTLTAGVNQILQQYAPKKAQ